MVWLFVKVLKTVKKDVGHKGMNEMWAQVVQKLRTDEKWQSIGNDKCKKSLNDLMEKLMTLEDDDIDAAIKFSTEAPTNLQDPVFSRWGTVLAAIEVFVENWAVIYLFAVALKGDNKSGCYKWQIACALISLMNNKSESSMEGQSLEPRIMSQKSTLQS